MNRRLLVLAGALAFLPIRARAQSTATLMGFDVYRSEALSVERAQAEVGGLVNSYMNMKNTGRGSLARRAGLLKEEIESKVAALGDFAYVKMYVGEYYTSAAHTAYVTFDVVDAKDAASRLHFRPAPEGHALDPEGLLAAWTQYSDLGSGLVKKGLISTDRPDCPALYCLWGSQTPELAAYERRFSQAAVSDKKLLLDVVEIESDPAKRMAAVYLLGYLPLGREVIEMMFDILRDPDENVRAAALRILGDIAVYHKDVFLDVKRIIPIIDYPAASDRAKALAILVELVEEPANRPYVMTDALPRLMALLRLSQPSNHDLAYTLLGQLSSESFGRRDYKAWEKWISEPKGAAKKKRRFLPW